jgi:uncharacterized protein (TIGR02594 family)
MSFEAFWIALKAWWSELTSPKVISLPEAPKKPDPKDKDLPWMVIAKQEIGQKEIAGEKHNPRIIEYHKYTDLGASKDEISWCSSFVCFCIERAGFKSTKDAWSKSWLTFGYPLDNPEYGCIVVFWRESINSWKGHVGFYHGESDKEIFVLGGNQNNQVSVTPYPKSQLLGYRWPKDYKIK